MLAQFVIKTNETNSLQIGAPLLRPRWAGHCDGGAGLQQDDALTGFVFFCHVGYFCCKVDTLLNSKYHQIGRTDLRLISPDKRQVV